MKKKLKENDIRPVKLYNKYISLINKDIKLYDFISHKISSCPFCSSKLNEFLFKKNKFSYVRCKFCYSIYSIDRPNLKVLKKYYNKSASNNFWYNKFWPTVVNKRVNLVFKERANFIYRNKSKFKLNFSKYIDVGSGNNEFLKIIQTKIKKKVYGIEPSSETLNFNKNIFVINSTLEASKLDKNSVSLFTVFELIEHTFSPKNFISKLYNSLKSNGTLILSFADPDGFELKTLGKKSTQFLPPLHLNFMTIAGCAILLKKIGFKEIQIISMGKLDTDIVQKKLVKSNNFVYNFTKIKYAQQILNKYNISSHKWLVAKK